jgi:O-acetyl-ADP-ribose deacetylase (regulator of RNase III)
LNGIPKYVVNFPTKDDLSPSKKDYVVNGLATLREDIKSLNIKSIAIPALGCGLGGLDWGQVKHIIGEFAKEIPDVKVIVYEPL